MEKRKYFHKTLNSLLKCVIGSAFFAQSLHVFSKPTVTELQFDPSGNANQILQIGKDGNEILGAIGQWNFAAFDASGPAIWMKGLLSEPQIPKEYELFGQYQLSRDGTAIVCKARVKETSGCVLLLWEISDILNQKLSPSVFAGLNKMQAVSQYWISDDASEWCAVDNAATANFVPTSISYQASQKIEIPNLENLNITVMSLSSGGKFYLLNALVNQDKKKEQSSEKEEKPDKEEKSDKKEDGAKKKFLTQEYQLIQYDLISKKYTTSAPFQITTLNDYPTLYVTDGSVILSSDRWDAQEANNLYFWNGQENSSINHLSIPKEINGVPNIAALVSCKNGEGFLCAFTQSDNNNGKTFFTYLWDGKSWTLVKNIAGESGDTVNLNIFGKAGEMAYVGFGSGGWPATYAALLDFSQKQATAVAFQEWLYNITEQDKRFDPTVFSVMPVGVYGVQDTYEGGKWVVVTKNNNTYQSTTYIVDFESEEKEEKKDKELKLSVESESKEQEAKEEQAREFKVIVSESLKQEEPKGAPEGANNQSRTCELF